MPRASSQKGRQPAQPAEQQAGPSSSVAAQSPSDLAGSAAGIQDRSLVILPDPEHRDADGEAPVAPGKGALSRAQIGAQPSPGNGSLSSGECVMQAVDLCIFKQVQSERAGLGRERQRRLKWMFPQCL